MKPKKTHNLIKKLLIFTLLISCIIVPYSNNETTVDAIEPTGICKGTIALGDIEKCKNETDLATKMKTVTAPAGTNYQAVWDRELLEFQWTDTSAMQNIDQWDGTNTEVPIKDANGYFIIQTAEQLAYVISNLKKDDKIRLTTNIDLKGYQHKWDIGQGLVNSMQILSISYGELIEGVEIDGGGFTIYNLGTSNNWFVRGLKHAVIKNLHFVSAKMYYENVTGNTYMGVFGALTSKAGIDEYAMEPNDVTSALDLANATTMTNISVENSIFYSSGISDMWRTGYISPLGHQIGVYADQIKTSNNALYAEGAHIGGAFGRPDAVKISNSYSLDSTIIANGNHSGGFISCTNGGLSVENCFTNNEVYAKESTGVFIGAIFTADNSPSTTFKNCYASGTLEGTKDLGGFIGMVEKRGRATINFENCYSTSIVGMENGGERLGGFIGSMASSAGGEMSNYTFTNCYAAGEVGHISTNVNIEDETHVGSNTVGGFAGEMGTLLEGNGSISTNNIYYDKQTTGMREWQTGNSMDSAKNLKDSSNGFDGYGNSDFKANIRGVLTSDSDKSGHGLASLPDPNADEIAGFTGFKNPGEWVFDGGNTDQTNHNCLYPQLSVFAKPDESVWGSEEVVDLVAASSYASVSTVHENVWEIGEQDQALSTTVYDTVRELTTRFTMTSYITSSLTNRDIKIDWKKTDKKVNLYGKEINVIGSLANSNSSKYNRPYITADKFAPGIEWLTVTVDVNGQKGTRKIRIIPTMNIEPGADNLSLNDGNTYNHAKDVKFAFSTGLRMSDPTDPDNITRALYPDARNDKNLFDDDRDAFVAKYAAENKLSPMDSFDNQDNDYIVNSKYITESDSATDLKYAESDTDYIHVRLFEIKSVTPIIDQNNNNLGTSGKLELDRNDDLLKDNTLSWKDKMNGVKSLETTDEGKYVIEYSCTLPDGRYLRDSKLLVIRKKNYDVSMQVLNYKDNNYDTDPQNSTLNNDVFSLNADKYTTVQDIPSAVDDAKENTFEIAGGVKIGTPVYMAGKKINSDYSVEAIKLEVESFGGTQSQVFETINVGNDTELEFLYDYYYGSYEVNGEYFVRIKEISKKYSIVFDGTKQIYYAVMNFDSEDSQYQELKDAGINIKDIDVDVKASIFVKNTNPTTGTLKIIKNTVDANGNPLATDEKFVLQIEGANSYQLGLLLSSATNNTANVYTVNLDAGNYTFDEIVPMRYKLLGFEVTQPDGSSIVLDKKFAIEAGKETVITLINQKLNDAGGTHHVTNTLKVAE